MNRKLNTTSPLFDFDDILIEPEMVSSISSRKEINVYLENGYLPLMTAPMDTVINENNFHLFQNNKIQPILPRTKDPDLDYIDSSVFLSYSLTDFKRIFLENTPRYEPTKKMLVLIDVANGHMNDLHISAERAKQKYGEWMVLMVGNVANPKTVGVLSKIGIDYIRIGIGNGGGCLTTQNTGIGYPMASLILESSNKVLGDTKLVADGGFKKYSDVIKALALGADYVMLGSILNKCLESAGETRQNTFHGTSQVINQYSEDARDFFNNGIHLYKTFRGMSTKEVQKSWGKEILTTSEGVVRTHQVEYTLNGWVDNFTDYLKSAMSYCDKKTLPDFIGKVNYNLITENSLNRFQK
jgi:IMP dehydrogenase/GMP reductase